jgi:hypothetical protein
LRSSILRLIGLDYAMHHNLDFRSSHSKDCLMPPKKLLTASIAAVLLVTTLGAVAAFTLKKTQKAWICGKKSEYPTYVLSSGNEYILAYPKDAYSAVNSYLVSLDTDQAPKRWLPEGIARSSIKSNSEGFSYTTKVLDGPESSGSKTTFSSKAGLLTISSLNAKEVPSSQRCTPAAWADVQSDLQSTRGVPVAYLDKRILLLEMLNPKLGQVEFNTHLANSLVEAPKSDYSIYKLLSVLPRDKLKTEQLDQIDQAKKNLIVATSSQQAFWEYENDFTYGYNGEEWKSMAEEAARLKCEGENEGSSGTLLADGYEIVSSVPQVKEFGWMKHDFDNGSWVRFKVDCKGKYFVMKKEGFID